jgi:DNA repair protein RecO (recombination protein O)
LSQLQLNHLKRRELLQKYMEYYALHVHDFGVMRTLLVMQEVLAP